MGLAALAVIASFSEHFLRFGMFPKTDIISLSLYMQTFTLILAAVLHYKEQLFSRVASTPLLVFWFTTIFSVFIRLRSAVSMGMYHYFFGSVFATCTLAILSLAATIAEMQPKPHMLYELLDDDDEFSNGESYESPEERANIFSYLTLTWLNPMITHGSKKTIEFDDIPKISKKKSPAAVSARFQRSWRDELDSEHPSYFRAILRTYWVNIALRIIIMTAHDLISFLHPILLSRLLGFIGSYNTPDAEPIEYGYFYSFAIFAVSLINSFVYMQYKLLGYRNSFYLKTSTMTAIYRKSLTLSNDARRKYSIGEIVSMMSVDSNRISVFLGETGCEFLSYPLQITIGMYMLYRTLGWSILVGVVCIIVSIPLSSSFAKWMKDLNKLLLEHKDRRIKVIDEVLAGIKVIKLYAWEVPFIKKISNIRDNQELDTVRKYGILQTIKILISTTLSFSVTFSSFAVYSLWDNSSHGPLNLQLVFVSLTLFTMIRTPIEGSIAFVLSAMETFVSIRRVESYLVSTDIDKSAITHQYYDRESANASASDVLVSVQNGNFKWITEEADLQLKNINIQCRSEELVAVIGKVGSGKSSLMSAIFGDMFKVSGTIGIRGSVAYVPQQPWIINATMQENILFGHEMDQQFYDKVVEACALKPDIEMLPAGDMTEIGEKGINLSGGQKARLSLARAVYARADIYILDDPLAAVDAHVSKHIFKHVIGPYGLLNSRARILATNSVQYLKDVDQVLMLKNGEVAEQGTFAEIVSRKSHIYKYVHKYVSGNNNSPGFSSSSSDSGSEIVENDEISSIGSNVASKNSSTLDLLASFDSADRSLISAERFDLGTARRSTAIRARAVISNANASESAAPVQTGQLIEREVNKKGKIKAKTYMTYIRSCGIKNVAVYVSLQFLMSASNVANSFWLKNWASKNEHGHRDSYSDSENNNVIYYLGIYGMIGVFYSVMTSLRSYYLYSVCSVKASKKLHKSMLMGVLNSPMSFFDVTPLGRIINRFSNDIQTCDFVLPGNMSIIFFVIFTISSSLFVIVYSTPLLLALFLPLIYVYNYMQNMYLCSSREITRINSSTKSPVFAHFQETIGGASSIRAYNQQDRFIKDNEGFLGNNLRVSYVSLFISRWLSIRLEAVGSLILLGTTMISISMLHLFGYTDAGLVAISITYAINLSGSLNMSVSAYVNAENCMTNFERIIEYYNLPSEAPSVIEDNRAAESWPEQGAVEFNDYSARYRKGLDLVLKGLSFHVAPRQKIGIVGRTGAGKSSLTLALFRIIEAASGQILIDGQDIAQYGLFDVRSKLSIIPQDPVLFAGTVRENIDPVGKHSDLEIWQALEHAQLADFVRSKEQGLEFEIDQGGSNFSVGQRQLICLTRALLKRARILVLDEATAAIDNNTDEIIQMSIRKQFKDCTVLTIAHRLNTIADSDKILVIDGGRVAEFDSPQKLLSNPDSIYSQMVEEARNSNSQM
ncbi:hypothetical protein H4R99_000340 [Coemansia sp. RSA 1722]|nr:hypothetical protein IWW45_004868 [Coemansia sp. RSA 485]KAJ2606508.1 hypothetical protein H4R99_000340 [Coemansia sp. RSA 1722]